jgi:hypothetical protein
MELDIFQLALPVALKMDCMIQSQTDICFNARTIQMLQENVASYTVVIRGLAIIGMALILWIQFQMVDTNVEMGSRKKLYLQIQMYLAM